MTYSADFRNKVVQLYNSGTSTSDLCAQFHISRSILYQWSEEANPCRPSESCSWEMRTAMQMRRPRNCLP